MRDSFTDQVIFSVPAIVSRLPDVVELLPGDMIFTGTPPDVGSGMKLPRFLADGDLLMRRALKCALWGGPLHAAGRYSSPVRRGLLWPRLRLPRNMPSNSCERSHPIAQPETPRPDRICP